MSDEEEVGGRESKAARVERIKREKDGLDVWDDILRYSREGFDAIDPEDFERFKWYGVYRQKPNNAHFMIRLRLPNGALRAHQLELIADITEHYARGFGDITTRQNIQLHWITIEDIPYLFSRLNAVGVTTVAACGDDPRNIVGCPVHGVDCDELYDARPLVDEVHRLYVGNREYSNLPRKFKTSISGCGIRCAQGEINDIGINALWRDGEVGFDLEVGGGLSTVPRIATRLDAFLRPDQVAPVCGAIAALFRDHGCRTKRTKARMKFLVEQWGGERFLEELEARLPFAIDHDVPPRPEMPHVRDHVGVFAQKQEGLNYVGLTVRLGRLTAEQMRTLARLSREFGDGTVRTTNSQNAILTGVPTARVDELARQAGNALMPADGDVWQRTFMACTGAQFCNLAVTATKETPGEPSPAESALGALQERLGHFSEFIRINFNGCPNSCGQHWVADVGLQGVLMKGAGGEQVEGALVTIGGGLGRESGFGRNIGCRLPLTDVADALVRLFSAYQELGGEDENFRGWALRTPDAELAAHMKGEAVVAAAG
ncbi:MAG: nitrite/sulfite reductase [Armatimonadetes bacterium]|nr:nitrite/sulfite reductase [Armatimonadota bacterium]